MAEDLKANQKLSDSEVLARKKLSFSAILSRLDSIITRLSLEFATFLVAGNDTTSCVI
jgi:hypothetical protein